jgi:PhoPQ-activated pathogenicity-related protein
VAGIRPYADAAVSILGVPALLITSGNPGPHYGEPKEGELMGQSLERMISTGDPRWNGYAWLGKVIVRGVTVMASLPETETRRAVVTGCSKRGMAAWIAAAADDRIAGAYPTCWNTGNYRETAKLLVDRYGGGYQRGRPDTRAPAFVSAQAQYERTLHPEFEKFSALTDPVLWGDRLADKEILYAFGTNDPLYHVLSCNLVVPKLAREPRVTLVPNTDHTPNTSQHITAWTMWVAHTLLGRDVPELEVHAETVDDRVTVDVEISGNTRLEKVELWWAEDPRGGYNGATWKSKTMTKEKGVYRATLDRPTGSHLVFFVAVHDDDPATCAGYITSRPIEIPPESG